MGLFSVVSRVPKMTMRAGDSRSPSVPLADLVKLLRNCATACRFPICSAAGSRGRHVSISPIAVRRLTTAQAMLRPPGPGLALRCLSMHNIHRCNDSS
jgi:hypothetical protein